MKSPVYQVGLQAPNSTYLSYVKKNYKNRNLLKKYCLTLGLDIDNLPVPYINNNGVKCTGNVITKINFSDNRINWVYNGTEYFLSVN